MVTSAQEQLLKELIPAHIDVDDPKSDYPQEERVSLTKEQVQRIMNALISKSATPAGYWTFDVEFYRKLQQCWAWLRIPDENRDPLQGFFKKHFQFSNVPKRFLVQAYRDFVDPLSLPEGYVNIGRFQLSLTWNASFSFRVAAPTESLSSIEDFWDTTLPILEPRREDRINIVRMANSARFSMSIDYVVGIHFYDLTYFNGSEKLLIDTRHEAKFFEYLSHLRENLVCTNADISLCLDDDTEAKPTTPANASLVFKAVEETEPGLLYFSEMEDPSGWMHIFHNSSCVKSIVLKDIVPSAIELLRQNENIVWVDYHLTERPNPIKTNSRPWKRSTSSKTGSRK